MSVAVALLYALAGLLGIAGLVYTFRVVRAPGVRTAIAVVLVPAAVYAAGYLTATATGIPQTYAGAPVTAWSELLGRLGLWLGLAAAAGVTINLIRRRTGGPRLRN